MQLSNSALNLVIDFLKFVDEKDNYTKLTHILFDIERNVENKYLLDKE